MSTVVTHERVAVRGRRVPWPTGDFFPASAPLHLRLLMPALGTDRPPNATRLAVKMFVAALGTGLVLLAACGGDGGSTTTAAVRSEGERIVRANGCASCHGADGSGGAGPSWVGLYRSQVELSDGSTVEADDAYLAESIRDPAAKRVAGYPITMPTNDLTDEEIVEVVEYIKSLT